MQVNVILDEPMAKILEDIKREYAGLNNSQAIRIALASYAKNFSPNCTKMSNEQDSSDSVSSAPSPAARQVCLERVAVVTLGLESDLAPLEGIESRLAAAGWNGLRWQSGTLFGRHPDYKEIELPLGAQVER